MTPPPDREPSSARSASDRGTGVDINSSVQSRWWLLRAEDDEDDVVMIRRALTKANFTFPVHAVLDGAEAIAYLNGDGIYGTANFPIPALILLDLNLPRVDGFEVLRWLRGQPSLGSIPVVVLTSSLDPPNANKAYALGASSFLAKPEDFQDSDRLLLLLATQWLPARVHRRDTALPAACPVRQAVCVP